MGRKHKEIRGVQRMPNSSVTSLLIKLGEKSKAVTINTKYCIN